MVRLRDKKYRTAEPAGRPLVGDTYERINRPHTARVACLAALVVLLLAATGAWAAWAESAVDEVVRAQMLKRRNGPIAHVESQYNDLFIAKRGPMLSLSTRFKANYNIHSMINLTDPDDMPAPYTQLMTAGLLYPQATKQILMIGLGAGSVSTYLMRAMPDVQIDVVELDPGVISVAKQYFGVRDGSPSHHRERWPGLPHAPQSALRPHPARRLSGTRSTISPSDEGVLCPRQRASGAGRRCFSQRRWWHQAL